MIGTPLSTLFNDNRIKAATSHCFLVGVRSLGDFMLFDLTAKNFSGYNIFGIAVFPDQGSPFIIALEENSCSFSYLLTIIKNVPDGNTALKDFEGEDRTELLLSSNSKAFPSEEDLQSRFAPIWVSQYSTPKRPELKWRLPSMGELILIGKYRSEINCLLSKLGKTPISTDCYYYSSLEKEYNTVWAVYFSENFWNAQGVYRLNDNIARPVISLSKIFRS